MKTDVAIVGAGPAGSAAALALRRAGIGEVALLHHPPPPRPRVGESATPDTRAHLQRLGLDSDLETRGHLPYLGTLSRWGSDYADGHDFALLGRGQGFHLDRERFDRDLRSAAADAGVQVDIIGRLVALGRDRGKWTLAFRDPGVHGQVQVVQARYLVDATGRKSLLTKRLGARRRYLDTLVALAIRRPLREPSRLRGYSMVEATADGWWYASGVPGGEAVITFMTDPDIARDEGLYDCQQLVQRLAETTLIPPELAMLELSENYAWSPSLTRADLSGNELGKHSQRGAKTGRAVIYPARTGFSTIAAGPGWLAVGDAAIAMDPLSSSGIACALADGIAAAEAIAADRAGDQSALRGYAARINQALGSYLRARQRIYLGETRWPKARFWYRRRPPTTARA